MGGIPRRGLDHKAAEHSGFVNSCSTNSTKNLDFLDRLKHLERRLVGADEKTFVVFAQAFTLQRIAASAFLFSCHDISPDGMGDE